MNSRFFPRKKAARYGWLAPALLGLAVLSGCNGDGYPENLTYPPRTDPLVTNPPDKDAVGFDKPGTVFELLEDPDYDIFKASNARSIIFPERDPRTGQTGLTAKQRDAIDQDLAKHFGTPRNPKVNGIPADAKKSLQLGDDRLAKGSVLFRLHCLHCHGVSGDGRGPTAAWVNPHPRDFRQGIFKFTSISQKVQLGSRKARRQDLLRTLRLGVEGTAMPSFGLLEDDDLEALVSYVIHLSLRGQCEFTAILYRLNPDKGARADVSVKEVLESIVPDWVASNDPANVIKPEFPYPYMKDGKPLQPGVTDPDDKVLQESVRRGFTNFQNPKGANCLSCHLDFGRQSPYKYDSWGTVVRPANLTRPIYRGGRRAIDLFWRVHSGINGSQMAPMPVGSQKQEQDIWDLVNFIQVLPFPGMLPPDIRDKVYPEIKKETAKE